MYRLSRGAQHDGPGDRDRRRAGDALNGDEGFPSSIRAVFFDAGLTLLHPDPPVEIVYAEAFARHGLAVSPDAVRRALRQTWADVGRMRAEGVDVFRGDAGERSFWRKFVATVFTRSGGGSLPFALLAELVATFSKEESWRVDEEAWTLLPALRGAGYRLLIVSNWDSSLPGLLDRLGLTPLFDAVLVSALVGASKPAREIFEAALRQAGVAAPAALHVGDSFEEDYEGARGAGLSALLLDRKGRRPDGVAGIASLGELRSRLLPSEA